MHRASPQPPAVSPIDPRECGRRGRSHRSPHRVWTLIAVAVTSLTTSACGGDASGEPAREYTFHLEAIENGDTYDFVAIDPIDLRVGDRVTFEMVNAGALIHDLQIVHPDGQPMGTTAAIASGDTVSVTVEFTDPGFYRLNCNVDNHLTEHDMQAIVEVTDEDGKSAA